MELQLNRYAMQKKIIFFQSCAVLFINLTTGLGDNDKTIIYDISQMDSNEVYILPMPEIKIKFDELAEQFDIGDKLSIRMSTNSTNLSPLFWYYPPIHHTSYPPLKRLIKLITRLSLELRIEYIPIKNRVIPVPKVRVISRDILGSARSKVSSMYQFSNNNNESIEFDIVEDIEQGDMLRLKGLYLGMNEAREIGNTIFQYKKNNGQWIPLDFKKYIVGSAKITSINENRFLRIKDQEYHLSVFIETGEYSSLRSGNNLKLLLSEGFEGRWIETGPQKIMIERDGVMHSIRVTPSIQDKNIIFPLPDLNYNRSRLSFPDLKIQCLSSANEPLTETTVSLLSDISSSVLIDKKNNFMTLGQVSDPIIFMSPMIELLGGNYRSFFKTDSVSKIDLRIKLELGSRLIPGDTIKLILPIEYPITWASARNDSHNLISVENIDEKSLGIIIRKDITDKLNVSLSLNMPNESIPPFNLSAVYPFLINMGGKTVKNNIRFGHIEINLAESQMVNTLNTHAFLRRIIVKEDLYSPMLRRGDIIEIFVGGDAFNFDEINMNKIAIKNIDQSDIFKLAINYSNSTKFKIVLNILSPFDPGEEIYIDNIPIYNIKGMLENVQLNYRINKGGLKTDRNRINMIYANAEFSNHNKFIRDVNSTPQLLTLEELHIDLKNIPQYVQSGQFLILQLPSRSAYWSSDQTPIIYPKQLFDIQYKSEKEMAISVKGGIGNTSNIQISGLSIIPEQNEFIDKELTCIFVGDSNITFDARGNISYTYPTIVSIMDQIYFTDDSTWNVYDLDINTGNLDIPILPGEYLTLINSDKSILWDPAANELRSLAVNNDLISKHVIIDKNYCHIVAADTIKDNTVLTISGLRIRPIDFPMNQFSILLSLDGGSTICAVDYDGKRLKTIKSKNEYSEKVNRAIKEGIYSMETGKTISLLIPENLPYIWDLNVENIQKVLIQNKVQLQKGDINFSVLDERVVYPNSKTVVLKIKQGYGSIDQGLRLSGHNRKKLYFKGLKLINQTTSEVRSSNTARINVIIESPYGYKNENIIKTGWRLLINGRTHDYFPLNDIENTEYVLTTPQVSRFNGRDVFEESQLQLYAEEQVLLRRPLVEFKNVNSDMAKLSLKNSLSYILGLYNDTHPKGNNWKTWYYLAWLKKRAIELDILDEIKENNLISSDKYLKNSTYSEDMERAANRGYSPLIWHQDYPSITMGTLIADINAKIDAAIIKYKNRDFLDAEDELLLIRREVTNDEKIQYLAAKIDYWLARIAITLDDSEYSTYRQSYAFQKLKIARSTFSNNISRFTRDTWLGDSIVVYRNIAKEQVNLNKKKINTDLIVTRGKNAITKFQNTSCEFNYKNDFSYAMRLKGIDNANVALVNSNDQSSMIYHDNLMAPALGQTLKFNKGGEYELRFSIPRQTIYNILLSVFIIGSIGIIYGP